MPAAAAALLSAISMNVISSSMPISFFKVSGLIQSHVANRSFPLSVGH